MLLIYFSRVPISGTPTLKKVGTLEGTAVDCCRRNVFFSHKNVFKWPLFPIAVECSLVRFSSLFRCRKRTNRTKATVDCDSPTTVAGCRRRIAFKNRKIFELGRNKVDLQRRFANGSPSQIEKKKSIIAGESPSFQKKVLKSP